LVPHRSLHRPGGLIKVQSLIVPISIPDWCDGTWNYASRGAFSGSSASCVRPSSQPALRAAGRAGRRPSGNVADCACLIGSRVRRGTPGPAFGSAGFLLCLV